MKEDAKYVKNARAETYSIIAGSSACPNRCPVCVSKMTPDCGVDDAYGFDRDLFKKACDIASEYGARNVLITGKGEPTLYPEQISEYLAILGEYDFGRFELQTAGNPIACGGEEYDGYLSEWKDSGLDLIAVSMYYPDDGRNMDVFGCAPEMRYSLGELVGKLESNGYQVRLSCLMLKGLVDSPYEAEKLISYSIENGVDELTFRQASRPAVSRSEAHARFVDSNCLNPDELADIGRYLKENGSLVRMLGHGARIYDFGDLSVCLTDGLSCEPNDEPESESENRAYRQLIFFPPDMLSNSWENAEDGRLL